MKTRLLTVGLAMAGLFAAMAAQAETHNFINKNYEDTQQEWSEQDYQVPAYPVQAKWQEFFLTPQSANRHFIDLGTLTIGQDGVVRYVLRIQSPSGVQNVSVEGLLCKDRKLRSYAFGDTVHHSWIESTRALWRKIDYDDTVHRQLRDAICPDGYPVKDVNEAAKRLAATR